jgi:hypothetical protein
MVVIGEDWVRWMPIEGFPGYSVNNLGQVRNDATDRILSVRENQFGVPFVGLVRGHQQYQRSLPLLVATAFIPNTSEIWDTPINLDGDRFNCAIENLMWRPRQFAIKYQQQFKYMPESYVEAPLRAIGDDEVFEDTLTAACRYGLLEVDIIASLKKGTPTWPTYQRWEFVKI